MFDERFELTSLSLCVQNTFQHSSVLLETDTFNLMSTRSIFVDGVIPLDESAPSNCFQLTADLLATLI
ncbi:hypothetical protein SAMN04487996_117104 [Dyadobacter soli]|uniref:Uncharacterized protein n=1 Tax=Dyadobacter soli TaxID=659014 RepID=A0A1G7T5X9_9BACT|nr:hypothetical protein SAMN04487996_117104 [Dyadobacter soli]